MPHVEVSPSEGSIVNRYLVHDRYRSMRRVAGIEDHQCSRVPERRDDMPKFLVCQGRWGTILKAVRSQ